MKICAFIGDMYRDYSASIIRTLKHLAVQRDHTIDIFGNCAVPNENPLHAEGLKSILFLPVLEKYDGIILCADTLSHSGIEKEIVEKLKNTEGLPPIISIRSDEKEFYNVVPDNRQIMYDITKYVLDKCGCGDVGFVTGRHDLKDSQERLEGFEAAMKDAGYEVTPEMIFRGNYWVDLAPQMADHFTREDGTLPRAIICSNDYMALSLLDELSDRGFNIPGDTMVTGLDNLSRTSVHIPSLTTYEISEEVLAEEAIDCLEKVVAGEKADRYSYVTDKMIIRESTGGTTERDLYMAYKRLEVVQHEYIYKTSDFILMDSDYEDVLSFKDCMRTTMNRLSQFKWFKHAYYCQYNETDRSMMFHMTQDDYEICDKHFNNDSALPDEHNGRNPGVRIFLPVHYKNVVYGYTVFELNNNFRGFFDERLEFMLILMGQTLNRLQLYERINDFEDVVSLYLRDALTSLYNRRGFDKNMSIIFNKYEHLAVASIDMDDLKYINDNFGHGMGDEAIKRLANCITASLRSDEFAARMGGDEFQVILIIDEPGRIGQFIRSFREKIRETNEKFDLEYTLSASVGTCELGDWNSIMECINKADKVMYLEKRSKKNK